VKKILDIIPKIINNEDWERLGLQPVIIERPCHSIPFPLKIIYKGDILKCREEKIDYHHLYILQKRCLGVMLTKNFQILQEWLFCYYGRNLKTMAK